MLFLILTILVFIEIFIAFTLYRRIGNEEHKWLLQIFGSFFLAGMIALPIEKYFDVNSVMWEIIVLFIGFCVICSLIEKLIHREAYAN